MSVGLTKVAAKTAADVCKHFQLGDEAKKHYKDAMTPKQLLDVLTTSGGYRMVSMALNTLGVQLEPGAVRFPAP